VAAAGSSKACVQFPLEYLRQPQPVEVQQARRPEVADLARVLFSSPPGQGTSDIIVNKS